MKTQTEAQQIADELESTPFQSTRYEAAAELRRLEAANTELLESLVEVLDYAVCERTSPFWDHFDRVSDKASAAIAKHGGAA